VDPLAENVSTFILSFSCTIKELRLVIAVLCVQGGLLI